MKKIYLLLAFLFSCQTIWAQQVVWEHTYGTPATEIRRCEPLPDGGFALLMIDGFNVSAARLDSMVETQLLQNKIQLELYMKQLDSLQQQLGSGTLSLQDSVVTAAAITGTMQQINNLVSLNKTALELARNQRTLTADNVKAVNEALGTGNLIEENERAVNSIYLATIAKRNAINSSQAAQLYNIATQCPMAGGNGVYRARALDTLVDNSITYNDEETCLQQGIILRQQQPLSVVKVYPNPASDKATLEYQLADEATGTLVLYNTLGQEVTQQSLNSKVKSIEFSTSHLSEGMYYYSVFSGAKTIGNGKLTIIR